MVGEVVVRVVREDRSQMCESGGVRLEYKEGEMLYQ